MKHVGVHSTHYKTGRDANPSQEYPQHYNTEHQFIHLAEEGQSGTKFLVQEDICTSIRLGLRQPKFKVFPTQQPCLYKHTKTRWGNAKKVILIV